MERLCCGQDIFAPRFYRRRATGPTVNVATTFMRNVQITGDMARARLHRWHGRKGWGLGNRVNRLYRSSMEATPGPRPIPAPPLRPRPRRFGLLCRHVQYPHLLATHRLGSAGGAQRCSALRLCVAHCGGDPGNIFYIRSTDMGATFSAPFQLNTNVEPTKAQWQPNLSVSPAHPPGHVVRRGPRVAASCQPSTPTTPCTSACPQVSR